MTIEITPSLLESPNLEQILYEAKKVELQKQEEFVLEINEENLDKISPVKIDYVISLSNKHFPNYTITPKIQVKTNRQVITDSPNLDKIEELDKHLGNQQHAILYIEHPTGNNSLLKMIEASKKLDKIANDIKNATNNGQPLSTFEKFMLIYEYVTNMSCSKNEISLKSRDWVEILMYQSLTRQDYPTLLNALCERVFTKGELVTMNQHAEIIAKYQSTENQPCSLIYMKDEKYNIEGFFFCDSYLDRKRDTETIENPLAFCCVPLKDLLELPNVKFAQDDLAHLFLSNYKNYTVYNDEDKTINAIRNILSDPKFSKFFHKHFTNIDYDFSEPLLSEEEKKNIEEYYQKSYDEVAQIFSTSLSKYSSLIIPSSLPEQLKEKINKLYSKNIKLIESNDEKAIENLVKLLKKYKISEKKAKKLSSSSYQPLNHFVCKMVATSKKGALTTKLNLEKIPKREALRQSVKDHFMEQLPQMATPNPIPLKAFINAYRIIGEKKGLTGDKLEEFIKIKILKSIRKTKEIYNKSDKCTNCFSTADINQKNITSLKK